MATTQPVALEREYETIYVLRQDVDPDGADRVAGRVTEVVAREQGKLVKVESWGRRRLAYDVGKQRRGAYFYVKYLGGGTLVNELERNLRMLDGVVKFQTVLLRRDVPVEAVVVDPEEIKFARLDAVAEEDSESPERALGLVDQEAAPARREPDFGDDEEADEGDWVPKPSEAPPAPAAGGKEEA